MERTQFICVGEEKKKQHSVKEEQSDGMTHSTANGGAGGAGGWGCALQLLQLH